MGKPVRFDIVIPVYKGEIDYIERLLQSIEDQDYIRKCVTIVLDGPDPELKDKLIKWVEDKKFYFCLEQLDENKGASAARNFGAQISGENLIPYGLDSEIDHTQDESVLFFIDADCKLAPGMLREISIQLDDNPDVSFVYGNYRFDKQHNFVAQGFDPYLLESFNYINTMSPVRREDFNMVGGFDEDRTYFQDWGLFYKLAKNGCTGKYIKEFIFDTKSADENSISGKPGLSLDEKSKEFREYYGIPERELVVSTFGAPLQAIQRAKMLNADYIGPAKDSNRMIVPSMLNFSNWKATYMVGCYNETLDALANHMHHGVGKMMFHFIGTDVMQMYHMHPMAELDEIQEKLTELGAKLFVNSPRMKEELAKCGLDAELLYTPLYNDRQYHTSPLPEEFRVAVYYSDTNPMHSLDNPERSNVHLIRDVALSMPDVKFVFFGGDRKYIAKDIMKYCPENIEFVGKIPSEDMPKFINSCSMNLRSTIHDGFPQLPVQFMMCGRAALVSCPDESMMYADKLSFEFIEDYEKNKEEVMEKIYKIKDEFKDNVALAKSATEYYPELMSVERFNKRIYENIPK